MTIERVHCLATFASYLPVKFRAILVANGFTSRSRLFLAPLIPTHVFLCIADRYALKGEEIIFSRSVLFMYFYLLLNNTPNAYFRWYPVFTRPRFTARNGHTRSFVRMEKQSTIVDVNMQVLKQ